ncbi:hypothetical protein AAVH_02836 [Aphelenchoides avenae]|nr:hypothetical protein AAVH_02836 [Aphelenchus avenae]
MTLKRDFGLKLELLASVGASADMEQTAKSSIMKHFTGGWPNSADESNNISEDMEKRFRGMWMVAVFDAE